jgi:hypothetical protein
MASMDVANRQGSMRTRAWAARRDDNRSAAFARARRHGFIVRVLRVLLPVVALALFASYGLFVQRSFSVGAGQLTIGPVSISKRARALRAH